MSESRHLLRIYFSACCLLFPAHLQAQEKLPVTKPARVYGTDLSNYVPTTTIWVVISPAFPRFNGNNTCLAGIYRKEKAISIYARNNNKHLWDLLQQLDRALEKHPQIKTYIVIHKSLFNGELNQSKQMFNTIEFHAKASKLKHIDVAMSRSRDGRSRLFDDRTELKFVYSEQRIVKLSQDFKQADESLKEVMSLAEKAFKLAAAK